MSRKFKKGDIVLIMAEVEYYDGDGQYSLIWPKRGGRFCERGKTIQRWFSTREMTQMIEDLDPSVDNTRSR